mgnify:CR=1 FL=1
MGFSWRAGEDHNRTPNATAARHTRLQPAPRSPSFAAANVMRMLEGGRGDSTKWGVIATAMAVGKTIGKTPVLVGICNGFVGNRLLFQRGIEANQRKLDNVLANQERIQANQEKILANQQAILGR